MFKQYEKAIERYEKKEIEEKNKDKGRWLLYKTLKNSLIKILNEIKEKTKNGNYSIEKSTWNQLSKLLRKSKKL